MTYPEPPPVDPLAPPTPAKQGRLVRMSDVVAEPINWLWDGHLARGKLHVIDGDPGLGKSTVTVDWAARVTTGKPWPDGQPGTDPAGVVLISVEDGLADTIRPRLDAAAADTDRVVVLTEIDTGHGEPRLPELPADVDVIRDALLSVDATLLSVDATLLVIDPLMACLPASVNSHRDQDIRRALAPLARVAEATGTAVVIVRHLTKGDGDKALYRGGGSIGIIGAARLGYTVARHPDDPDNPHRAVLAGTKANITTMPASLAYHLVGDEIHGCARIEWEGDVPYTANDLLRRPTAPEAGQRPARPVARRQPHRPGRRGPVRRDPRRRDRGRHLRTKPPPRPATRPRHLHTHRLPRAHPLATTQPDNASETDRTGRAVQNGRVEAQSGHHPPDPGRTGRTGRSGRTGRTEPPGIGPCARCHRPTRRYGAHAEGTLCSDCRDTQGGPA